MCGNLPKTTSSPGWPRAPPLAKIPTSNCRTVFLFPKPQARSVRNVSDKNLSADQRTSCGRSYREYGPFQLDAADHRCACPIGISCALVVQIGCAPTELAYQPVHKCI